MLTVLKIIGIALLAILALVLLILLIVLFVPLRLDIRARYEEEIRARVTVSWLLKALLVRLEWLKDHGLLRVKLLGLKTLMKKHLGDWGPESEGQKIAPEDNPPAQKAEAEAPPAEEKTEETAGKTESKGASKQEIL